MNQQQRIAELKRRASELAGGKMVFGESPGMDPDIQEQFWSRVVESAPQKPGSDPGRLGKDS